MRRKSLKDDPADATDDQASKDNHCYLPCGNAALQDNIVNDQTCRNSEEDASKIPPSKQAKSIASCPKPAPRTPNVTSVLQHGDREARRGRTCE